MSPLTGTYRIELRHMCPTIWLASLSSVSLFLLSKTSSRTIDSNQRLLRPNGDLLGRIPLLDERQELWLTRDILLQHLGNIESLRRLVVLEDTAQRALRRTDYSTISISSSMSKER
jgi:hypothetical protein